MNEPKNEMNDEMNKKQKTIERNNEYIIHTSTISMLFNVNNTMLFI